MAFRPSGRSDEQAVCLRAIEDKRFLPVGSDKEASAEFQLIAGTNRDLGDDVQAGRFREDLYARLNLWTFQLPALRERPEDIEPNVDFELKRYLEREGQNVTFNKEARQYYLDFATGSQGQWHANFRDMSASITRMATLTPQGRITADEVKEEIAGRRSKAGENPDHKTIEMVMGEDGANRLDLFDKAQLSAVLKTCGESQSASAAGRVLFAQSRQEKKSANDADRLIKYLSRFGLSFDEARERLRSASLP